MKLWLRSLPFLFLSLAAPLTAGAQERYQDRLPANTLAYIASPGDRALDSVRGTNPLLRLLASPEMKANWEAVKASQTRANEARAKPEASAEDEEIFELFKSPGLVALLPPDPNAQPDASGPPQPIILFLLDATGQEERIERLRTRAQGEGESYVTYEFEGVSVEEARNRDGKPTGYLARLDRWLVGGSDKAATEGWLQAVRQAPAASLKDAVALQRARGMLNRAGQAEAYLNLPALVDLFAAVPSLGQSAPPPEQIVAALGLRAFGPLLATADFRADTTHYEIVLARGEAAPSPLDALGPAAPQFASLSLGGSDALGYSVTRVDLQAGWDFLRGAASTLFPPAALFVEMADSFLHEQTGFTLPQVIGALGDEVAHFEYAGKGELPFEMAWAVRHHDRTRLLAVVEGMLPVIGQRFGMKELERIGVKDGIPTYYKLAFKSETAPEGEKEEEAAPSMFLAVTEDWLLITPSESALKRTFSRATDSPSLASSEVYRRARSRFPAELSTFAFMDVDAWLANGAIERIFEQAVAAQQAQPESDGAAGAAPPDPPSPPPKITIPRGYLKWIVTGTSQDARGIYHSGYIE